MVTKEQRFFNSEIELRADDGKNIIRGYAVKYDQLSRPIGWGFREKFSRGAFDSILASDTKNVEFDTICKFEHDITLGRRSSGTLQIGSDEIGLWYEIDLPGTTTGKDVAELVRRGDIRHSSFAFIVAKGGEQWEEREADGEVRTINKVSYLKDVSPVSDPAYPQTEGLESVKRSYEEWKKENKPENEEEIKEDWNAQYRARHLELLNKQLNF